MIRKAMITIESHTCAKFKKSDICSASVTLGERPVIVFNSVGKRYTVYMYNNEVLFVKGMEGNFL